MAKDNMNLLRFQLGFLDYNTQVKSWNVYKSVLHIEKDDETKLQINQ